MREQDKAEYWDLPEISEPCLRGSLLGVGDCEPVSTAVGDACFESSAAALYSDCISPSQAVDLAARLFLLTVLSAIANELSPEWSA